MLLQIKQFTNPIKPDHTVSPRHNPDVILTSRTATSKEEPNYSSFCIGCLEFPDKAGPLITLKISEKLKALLAIGDCPALSKKHAAQHESQRSNRTQTDCHETQGSFRSQHCTGKVHRQPSSYPSVFRYFFILESCTGERGGRKWNLCPRLNSFLQGLSGCFHQ